MWQNINGWHALIIVAVIVLIFGTSRLPALAQGLGQSLRIFRGATRENDSGERQSEAGNTEGQPRTGENAK
ncbi:MAG: twin-arginine translocase TatA/TatE family subunit [Microbacterium sp.]|uniref:twin-arginine translocase TatA/TatE family subunit n=1 Tax=Microbacterium sp. TaxID=51671 RepID=UPI003F7D4F4B